MIRRSFAALKSPGKLCTWSDGFYTKLGLSPAREILRPTAIPSLSVLDVFPGPRHTLVLTAVGSLCSFGQNDYGQLGLRERKEEETPLEVVDCAEKIVGAACGANYSLAVTEDGDVLEWGQAGRGQSFLSKLFLRQPSSTLVNAYPRLLSSLSDEKVVSVAAGYLHYLALTETGGVYAWGDNEHGSCGTGSILEEYKAPRRLSFFDELAEKESVKAIFACGNTSAALTTAGKVYMWGENDKGQLAVETRVQSQATPLGLQSLSEKEVIDVSLGYRTSAFLCSDGSVFVCGAGQWTLPFPVPLPTDFHAASIASSEDFFAFIGTDGTLCAMGGPFPGSENRPQEIPETVTRVEQALFPGKVAKLVAPYNYCTAIIWGSSQ